MQKQVFNHTRLSYLLILATALAFSPVKLFCQDPVFSQFFANRMFLNPSFTGIERGMQFNASTRIQWYNADKGYELYVASAEWQESCIRSGFGLSVLHSREGLAPLITNGASFNYAYTLPYSDRGNIHFGLQYTFTQKRLDWSRLTFSDQLDPIFGSIYPTSVTPLAGKSEFHDFAFGAMWRWDSKLKSVRGKLLQFRSHLGLSIHHLASLTGQGPDESFLQSGSQIPARITLHGGTIIPLTFLEGAGNKLVVSPNVRLESQGIHPVNLNKSLTLVSGGVYIIFMNQITAGILYNSRSGLPQVKHTTYFTGSVGLSNFKQEQQKSPFYLGFSVDVNATGLGYRSGNVYEFNLRYTFRNAKTFCDISKRGNKPSSPRKPLECPVFDY